MNARPLTCANSDPDDFEARLQEYVLQLQRRHKWFSESNCNICVGSFAWIVDNGSPKGHYPLAQVSKLNIGDDGVTQSTVAKTSKGSFVRPLVKLVPLPLCSFCDQGRPGMFGTNSFKLTYIVCCCTVLPLL